MEDYITSEIKRIKNCMDEKTAIRYLLLQEQTDTVEAIKRKICYHRYDFIGFHFDKRTKTGHNESICKKCLGMRTISFWHNDEDDSYYDAYVGTPQYKIANIIANYGLDTELITRYIPTNDEEREKLILYAFEHFDIHHATILNQLITPTPFQEYILFQ